MLDEVYSAIGMVFSSATSCFFVTSVQMLRPGVSDAGEGLSFTIIDAMLLQPAELSYL